MNKTHEQIAGDAAQTICVLVAAELQKLVAQCDDGTAPKDSPSPSTALRCAASLPASAPRSAACWR